VAHFDRRVKLFRWPQPCNKAWRGAHIYPEDDSMNTMSDSKNIAKAGASGKIRMTPSEAFVETLVAQGVKDTFGIVGSAYMDAHDLFPLAGIRFLSVAHEQNAAHMADGYSRVTGKHGVCIAQNGPGITNFVTGIAAAYWAHSPVVCVTPESGSMSMGLGGFQETEQMPIFSKITKWQVHVNSPLRIAELTGRAFDIAMAERGPVQVNIPRDYFYGEGEYDIPQPHKLERGVAGCGGTHAGQGQVPGDPVRWRRDHGRRHQGMRSAGRVSDRAGGELLSAQ
jgi:hypothetical protein